MTASKKAERMVGRVNEAFPASSKNHPIAFVRDGRGIVTSESSYVEEFEGEKVEAIAIDYYGEFRGGYPFVSKKLVRLLERYGYDYEWESPACIVIFEK